MKFLLGQKRADIYFQRHDKLGKVNRSYWNYSESQKMNMAAKQCISPKTSLFWKKWRNFLVKKLPVHA